MHVLWIALGIAAGTGLAGFLACVWAWRKAHELPYLDPVVFLALGSPRGDGPLVGCAGDSITHGRVSAPYVDLLRERLGPRGATFINAGTNGELSYNLLQRLDHIVQCRPDVVTVLIGTNDATASLSQLKTAKALKQKGLTEPPTPDLYRAWLTGIIQGLQSRTDARIALLSPPPIGEQPDHPYYVRSGEYAVIAREVAQERGVGYLPLHEEMVAIIQARTDASPLPYDERGTPVLLAMLSHYLLRRSWDEIGRRNGYLLLTDSLHLNGRGAGLVAELIKGFVER